MVSLSRVGLPASATTYAGGKSNVLSDFFIGAHAAVSGYPILTRDTLRYSAYFSGVTLIEPD